MPRKLNIALVLGALFLMAEGTSAQASALFTFDTLSPSAGDDSSTIATYMTNTLTGLGCVGCTVKVGTQNAAGQGVAADTTYNGDKHVVGPNTGATSLTLGDTTNATGSTPTSGLNLKADGSIKYDTFLSNTTNGSSQLSNQFTMIFSDILITSVSFDYEIFADGSGAQPPDFVFKVANTGGTTTVWTKVGVTPGTSPITATHSPNSGGTNKEGSAQLIGTWSGSFSPGATELEFIDWPQTIGIDNLEITYTYCGLLGCTGITGGPPTLVPAPASLPLLGTGLLLGWAMRRRLSQRA